MLSTILMDVRFAFRQYRRRSGSALLTVLILAFGIGATTAVYTIVHAALLRPLPFADSDSLVMAWDNAPQDGDRFKARLVSGEDFREITRSSKLLDRIAASGRLRPVLRQGAAAKRTMAGLVTVGMFRDTLGSTAMLGRTFIDADLRGGCAVVLAYPFWSRSLGRDAALVGQALQFDQDRCTVVGVMPQGFDLFPIGADMWFLRDHSPVASTEVIRRRGDLDNGILYARLKPGVSAAQAEAELTQLHKLLHAAATPLNPNNRSERANVVAVTPVRTAVMGVVAPSLERSLWLAMSAVGFLLLIACVNIANLLLAQLSDRRREMMVRSALGSGRARLIGQVLTEGALLAGAGTVAGVVLAWAGVAWFRSLNVDFLPTQTGEVGINPRVLSFAVALSVVTTLIFSLIPALASGGLDLSRGLREAGRGLFGSVRRLRTAKAMVAVQIALCMVLVSGAGLLTSSALGLQQEDLGYDVTGIAAASGDLPPDKYATPEARAGFRNRLRARLESLPGTARVAFGYFPPETEGGDTQIEVQGKPLESAFDVAVVPADREYFEALRVPLRRGRNFSDADRTGPPLAIVSQRFVDEYFRDADPLGKAIRVVDGDQRGEWKTIVGVIGPWKHLIDTSAWRDTAVVFSIGGSNTAFGAGIGVGFRTNGDPARMTEELRREISALEPNAIVHDPDVPVERLSSILSYARFRAILVTVFSVGALLLAMAGLHGVVAQLVSQRIPEFGIRRAVGAQTHNLLWLVAKQGGAAVLAGLGLGFAGTLAAGRWVESMLYRIESNDERILAASIVVLSLGAALGVFAPSLRAANVDPATALRQE